MFGTKYLIQLRYASGKFNRDWFRLEYSSHINFNSNLLLLCTKLLISAWKKWILAVVCAKPRNYLNLVKPGWDMVTALIYVFHPILVFISLTFVICTLLQWYLVPNVSYTSEMPLPNLIDISSHLEIASIYIFIRFHRNCAPNI